ncbi:MAG: argininosuccinate lyase [Chloroflexi bacterium]|nr:argininosuccinate lyase [Chloroflexota bacterium]MBV9133342.1 argininosuccinate lyase [Chloroflexota bacterium]
MTDQGYSLRTSVPPLELPDFYASMSAMNKASLVMLREAGIIPQELASRIASGIQQLIDREAAPDASRSHDYLNFEHALLEIVGAEGSWLHVGRSRQDMLSTGVSLWLRAAHLAFMQDLLPVREVMLELASRNSDTVMPIYTHGVQAQPTTFAHYLLAILSGLERSSARIMESYQRTNRSPLGAGAGTTSSFAINRARLAELLGFGAIVDNAFDANLVAPVDSSVEFVQLLATVSVQVAQFVQDLMAQFYLTEPWLILDPASSLTGISSMMPQKRNPRVLEVLREHASIIIGSAESMTLLAHNVTSGMSDVRETVTSVVPISRAHELLYLLLRTVRAIVVDPQRSLAEVNRDYSATTNLAEVLVQSAGVPFREAHEFASHLTDFGRQRGLKPTEIDYTQAASVYGAALPITAAELARALDPRHIIATREGSGGPQPREVERMRGDAADVLHEHQKWLAESQRSVAEATTALDAEFHKLAALADVA